LTSAHGRKPSKPAKRKTKTGRLVLGAEAEIQAQFVSYIKENEPRIAKSMFSVPNEGARSFATLTYLKKLGLLKGVSDLIILYPTSLYPGLIMEFKTPRTSLTPGQEDFLRQQHALGYYTCVPRSVFEAVDHFYAYLNNEPRHQNY